MEVIESNEDGLPSSDAAVGSPGTHGSEAPPPPMVTV
jgi:hypothetical protein